MKKEILRIINEGLVFDTAFHPESELIAVGNIYGSVSIYNYQGKELMTSCIHSDSVRSLTFNTMNLLATASKDRSLKLYDVNLEKPLAWKNKAHKYPINKLLTIDESIICTGDDQGCIKVWDLRAKKEVRTYHENVDYISDMIYEKNLLIASSGDGCLSVFDLRLKKPIKVSDNQDDELLSIQSVRVFEL
jgi:WD40 repeat protein